MNQLFHNCSLISPLCQQFLQFVAAFQGKAGRGGVLLNSKHHCIWSPELLSIPHTFVLPRSLSVQSPILVDKGLLPNLVCGVPPKPVSPGREWQNPTRRGGCIGGARKLLKTSLVVSSPTPLDQLLYTLRKFSCLPAAIADWSDHSTHPPGVTKTSLISNRLSHCTKPSCPTQYQPKASWAGKRSENV